MPVCWLKTYLVFDEPDKAMHASLNQLSAMMGCAPIGGKLDHTVLPPANIMDQETEKGRMAARLLFEEWLDCEFEFHNLMLVIIHNVLVHWEEDGQRRAATLRLLIESVHQCMGFELAAQELCDVVIDRKVSYEGWSLGDCIASLSAVAGRRLALSLNTDACMIFRGCDLPDNLDHVVHVMTQEAVRLGVPAGPDWRFWLGGQ